ncbi:MAG: ATP-binding cassette domain-containing protein [Flavobacteriales bacterium]|jgi:ABC-2 type transport system ATP-binding protein|nr:ATP-binding cassette domain-containing protein [Flavobacteriales bacterium]MBK9538397.1 ATP-binding cassette domain-containing protein [Flavobacteriales bacterium]
MLRCEHIVKRYGAHTALDDVSMEVPAGLVFGLLGPNGAGKTSLIRVITRITGPDEGRVLLDGHPMTDADVAQLGYLPEERGLYKKMKVGEQAVYLARLKGMRKSDAIKQLKEWFERWEMMAWWNKKVEELSKGMAQKVQFVTTVLHRPRLLILDEPFSGFDPINAELVRQEILRMRAEGTTVMLSTHNMGSVEELCDHIALIDRSRKVLDGRVRDIRRQYATNTYRIEYKGPQVAFANALSFTGELLDVQNGEDMSVARVRIAKDGTLNQVLKQVLTAVEVRGVHEEIPSMHDVFIRAVGDNDPANVKADMTD